MYEHALQLIIEDTEVQFECRKFPQAKTQPRSSHVLVFWHSRSKRACTPSTLHFIERLICADVNAEPVISLLPDYYAGETFMVNMTSAGILITLTYYNTMIINALGR